MDHRFALTDLLAYFDPGQGSLLLQTLVCGSAGLLVFANYLWIKLSRCWHRKKSSIGGEPF